jgi:hypothetical protein
MAWAVAAASAGHEQTETLIADAILGRDPMLDPSPLKNSSRTWASPRRSSSAPATARRGYSETRRMMKWFRKVDGRFVFGGRGAFGKEDTVSSFEALRRAMTALFPELGGLAIEFRWSGLVGMTFSQLPHVGRIDDRACVAFGYNGVGIKTGAFPFAARTGRPVGRGLVPDARRARPMTGQPRTEFARAMRPSGCERLRDA